jgi:hypothetical protein
VRRADCREILDEQTELMTTSTWEIARGDCSVAQDGLASLDFEWAADIEPGVAGAACHARSARPAGRLVPVVFDDAGNEWQELPRRKVGRYSAEGLRGSERMPHPCRTAANDV